LYLQLLLSSGDGFHVDFQNDRRVAHRTSLLACCLCLVCQYRM
jgi:hypothetical protein